MRPITVTVTNSGESNVIPLDHYISPFNVGFGVALTGNVNAVTYTIQHTFDDVFAYDFAAANATWFNHEDLVGQTTNQDGNYAFPVTGIRVNVAANSVGTTSLTAIQAGIA